MSSQERTDGFLYILLAAVLVGPLLGVILELLLR